MTPSVFITYLKLTSKASALSVEKLRVLGQTASKGNSLLRSNLEMISAHMNSMMSGFQLYAVPVVVCTSAK